MVPLLTSWPRLGRVATWVLVAILAFLAFIFVMLAAGGAEEKEELPWLWGMAAVCLIGIWFFIGLARLQLWLSGDRLIKQGAFWRSSFPLRRVRFSMKVMKWRYTTQLASGAVHTVEVESPALVVRTSWWRRVRLPLIQRTGHTEGNQIVLLWLQTDLREMLASAIETHATDPRKDKVARFLRHVERSPVRPQGEADLPSL